MVLDDPWVVGPGWALKVYIHPSFTFLGPVRCVSGPDLAQKPRNWPRWGLKSSCRDGAKYIGVTANLH